MHQSKALVEMVKDMMFLKNIYSIIRPKNVKKQVKMPKNRLFEIEKLATSLFFMGIRKNWSRDDLIITAHLTHLMSSECLICSVGLI